MAEGLKTGENTQEKEQERKKAERQLGAKVLAGVGYQDRQREIVDSSLAKEMARGEKLQGKNAERRNLAYLSRLERMIDQHGNALEKKLWDASMEKLIIDPANIEERYWKSQEQILRDHGCGRKIDDYEKSFLVRDIQDRQRESLKSWSDYLGDENAPYPLWFKVYAWDGVSKMGVFDKDEKQFAKRNEHTVAPYPKLNAAVLAKVYGALSDFYDDKGRKTASERDEEKEGKLKILVRSGNFNKLYSKFLLEQKAIPKTPERTEDVHGEWVEYLPGQEQAVANAAEGTPWCVADPGTARNYLEYNGDDDWDDYDDGDRRASKAKFILFHLEDPETGNLAENACASIRLDTDGQVAEISGLNDGQALEDSLVPIVEEKVKTLPGGERFLEAFADKKRLMALDRKMQAGEELTEEDVEFVFEKNRPIKTLDTYADDDPRIGELRNFAVDKLIEQLGAEGALEKLDGFGNDAVKKTLESRHTYKRLVEELGTATAIREIEKRPGVDLLESAAVYDIDFEEDLDALLEFYPGWKIVQFMLPDQIERNLDKLTKDGWSNRWGEDIFEGLERDKVEEYVKQHLDQWMKEEDRNLTSVLKYMDKDFINEHFNELVYRVSDLGELIQRTNSEVAKSNIDILLDDDLNKKREGLDMRNVMDGYLSPRDIAETIGSWGPPAEEPAMKKLLEKGVNPDVFVNYRRRWTSVDEYFDQYAEIGVSPELLMDKFSMLGLRKNAEKLVALGASREDIEKRLAGIFN